MYVVSKKVKLYDTGDCVEVTTWDGCDAEGFFCPAKHVGLVLEAVYIEMDDAARAFVNDDGCEWMYRVSISDGQIVEAWDYEIRPVNVLGKEYNNLSHSQ